MKLFFTVLSIFGFGLIGYTVGYLSGAVTGVALYWRKSQREHKRQQILEYLDRTTVWETEEAD